MKKNKKKSIKQKKESKKFLLRRILFVIICLFFLFSLGFLIFRIIKTDEIFKVVDRTNDIEKYKKKEDGDIVGWIKVQGTNIDYPVLLHGDELVDDVSVDIGWTYIRSKKLNDRTVVEGHNILNLSSNPLIADKSSKRFEQLLSFYDINFVRNNKYIEYSANGENYVFKIFAVGFPKIEYYYMKSDYTEEEMKKYINSAIDDSLYKFDIDVNENDKIISLYTCTKFYGVEKAVVFRIDGRLLRDDETTANYNVSKTVNYDNAKKYSASKLESVEEQL